MNSQKPPKGGPPSAPPVYRPQPVPKVCQRKPAIAAPARPQVPARPQMPAKPQIKTPALPTVAQRQSPKRPQLSPPKNLSAPTVQRSTPKPHTPRRQQAIQLKPTYDDYKKWLDKQTIPAMLRATLNNRLGWAQRAIAYTRQKLVHGAGNITEQVKKSKEYSVLYTRQAYLRYPAFAQKLERDTHGREDKLLNNLLAQAITARKTRAGNCDHFAAIALFYLIEHAPTNSGMLFRLSVGTSGNGHSVVIYADGDWTPAVANDQNSYHTAVVVDAWPTHAFACAWADWKYRTDHPRIILALAPQSDDGTRKRVVRDFRDELRDSDEYRQLQQVKRRSTSDYNEWLMFRDDLNLTYSYPQWTDEHPLYANHPSDDCFITTACVEAAGLRDNCSELNTLRAFRDGFMLGHPDGEALITEYYAIAPGIVKTIREQPNAHEILRSLFAPIQDCVMLIKAGENEAALWHYVAMVQALKGTYFHY